MSKAERVGEPSMDEILASIRRIIAEEPPSGRGSRPSDAAAVAPLPSNPLVARSASGSGSAPGAAAKIEIPVPTFGRLADTQRNAMPAPAPVPAPAQALAPAPVSAAPFGVGARPTSIDSGFSRAVIDEDLADLLMEPFPAPAPGAPAPGIASTAVGAPAAGEGAITPAPVLPAPLPPMPAPPATFASVPPPPAPPPQAAAQSASASHAAAPKPPPAPAPSVVVPAAPVDAWAIWRTAPARSQPAAPAAAAASVSAAAAEAGAPAQLASGAAGPAPLPPSASSDLGSLVANEEGSAQREEPSQSIPPPPTAPFPRRTSFMPAPPPGPKLNGATSADPPQASVGAPAAVEPKPGSAGPVVIAAMPAMPPKPTPPPAPGSTAASTRAHSGLAGKSDASAAAGAGVPLPPRQISLGGGSPFAPGSGWLSTRQQPSRNVAPEASARSEEPDAKIEGSSDTAADAATALGVLAAGLAAANSQSAAGIAHDPAGQPEDAVAIEARTVKADAAPAEALPAAEALNSAHEAKGRAQAESASPAADDRPAAAGSNDAAQPAAALHAGKVAAEQKASQSITADSAFDGGASSPANVRSDDAQRVPPPAVEAITSERAAPLAAVDGAAPRPAPQAAAPAPAPAAAPPPAAAATAPVRTLEDAVAEMLRPMLQQWLTDNMPRIVEKALKIETTQVVKDKVQGT